MRIEFKDYVITPSPFSKGRYDLAKKTIGTAKVDGKKYKKGEKYEKEIIQAYALKMSTVIKHIIFDAATSGDEVVTLKEFISHYEKVAKEIENEFKTLEV